MGRPGGGGGRPSSSGGSHSSSRSGGGVHRIGSSSSHSSSRPGSSSFHSSSSRPGSSSHTSSTSYHSTYSAPKPQPKPSYMPPPPRPLPRPSVSYRRTYHRGYGSSYNRTTVYTNVSGKVAALTTVAIVFAVLLFVSVFAYIGYKTSTPVSSYAREKLSDVPAYDNSNVWDECDWFDNISKTSRGLQNFYNETGVQPYILIKAYDSSLTTDNLREEWTKDFFENNLASENGFLLVYFEEADLDEIGPIFYRYGIRTPAVMDAEAVDILFNYLDNYWTTNLSSDDMFIKTFDSTAKTIMQRSKTGKDILFVVLMIVFVVATGVSVVTIIKVKRKAEKEKAAETERILSTPISDVPLGSSKVDDIIEKYKD